MKFRVLENYSEESNDPLTEMSYPELLELLCEAEQPLEEHWPDGTIVREKKSDVEPVDSFAHEIRREIETRDRKRFK